MAARLNPAPAPSPPMVELRRLSARTLDALLQEETGAWRQMLEWNFDKSADLVRRFLDLRALNGFALLEGGRAVGYVYYVLEESKGLLGDLYVVREHRTVERENQLLAAALDAIWLHPQIHRIESQLMMLEFSPGRPVPGARTLTSFERNFMRIDLHRSALTEGRLRRQVYVEHWSDPHQEPASHLIAAAYHGHVDSQINDQYRTASGARRFLHNIVQYPGCGAFFRPGSFAAFDVSRGELVGISLYRAWYRRNAAISLRFAFPPK